MSFNVSVDRSSMASGLLSLYQNQELTDVRLVCSDGQVWAHKAVLSAVSDSLRRLLSDQSGHKCEPTVILLSDMSVADVKQVVDCLYYGQMPVTSNQFKKLSLIASQLDICLRPTVSVALEEIGLSSDSSRMSTPHPKTGVRSSPRSGITAVTEELVFEEPIDLSSPKLSLDDNVTKVIESVAANGPQTKRRRKQSSPKSVKKTVRFDESNNSALWTDDIGRHIEHNTNRDIKTFDIHCDTDVESTIDDEQAVAKVVDQSKSLSDSGAFMEVMKSLDRKVAPQPPPPIAEAVNLTNPTPIRLVKQTDSKPTKPTDPTPAKTVDSVQAENTSSPMVKPSPFKVLPRPKPVGRPPKTATNSTEELRECCVCGQSMPNSKQLVIHLNKEHKTNDTFKCCCGKEQKYAKTFVAHYVQCHRTVRNGQQ